MRKITVQNINKENFDPFGDIINTDGSPDKLINDGLCERYNDRAKLDFSNGKAGISIFNAKVGKLPYEFDMLERHPYGSQAFLPLTGNPFLVIVAQNNMENKPKIPQAFITEKNQGINIHRNIWHGVLTPLTAPGLFAVVDRIGPGDNLEEYFLTEKFQVKL
tara:strand:+ start:70 stop:555 length:486 start_codon:yes stop_codon:yes gene_type:complete